MTLSWHHVDSVTLQVDDGDAGRSRHHTSSSTAHERVRLARLEEAGRQRGTLLSSAPWTARTPLQGPLQGTPARTHEEQDRGQSRPPTLWRRQTQSIFWTNLFEFSYKANHPTKTHPDQHSLPETLPTFLFLTKGFFFLWPKAKAFQEENSLLVEHRSSQHDRKSLYSSSCPPSLNRNCKKIVFSVAFRCSIPLRQIH